MDKPVGYGCYLAGGFFQKTLYDSVRSGLRHGTILRLKRNPRNEFDSNAVEVWLHREDMTVEELSACRGSILPGAAALMLGHLAKRVAAVAAPMMDKGVEFECSFERVPMTPDKYDPKIMLLGDGGRRVLSTMDAKRESAGFSASNVPPNRY